MPKKPPKRPPERPKTTLKRTQDDQKSDPERQDDKRTEPRRFQDRLGSAPRGPTPSLVSPQGHHLGAQIGTKTDPKTMPKRSEKSRVQKTDSRRSWTRLGAILDRLERHLGPTWTSKSCSRPRWRSFFGKITFSMLRRFEDGYGTNFGRPRRQNDRK